jgi:hypothetical protein
MTDSLFAEEVKEDHIDWMNEVARKRYGMPERWRWFRSEVKNHDKPSAFIMLTGAICDAKIKRGKYKGNDDWKKRDKTSEAEIPIKFGDIKEVQAEWEAETGKCSNCRGSGKSWIGWGKDTGNRFEPCRPCSATGRVAKNTDAPPVAVFGED